jgi:protein gp37
MGHNSNIEWCDHTFNPWIGCTKVSPGCAKCYAETLDRNRFSKTLGGASKAAPVPHWGKGAPRHRTSVANWRQPIFWNTKEALDAMSRTAGPYVRPRVFCASLADWLDDEVPIEWLADLLALINATPNLDWLLLTKRPENFRRRLEQTLDTPADETVSQSLLGWPGMVVAWLGLWGVKQETPDNVWIGTTVEDQQRADERIPVLLEIPAKVRFLSCEPLLEQIFIECYMRGILPNGKVRWVICGGESGKDSRPFVVEWADDIRRQCETAGVPFFMKQMGENPITSNANVLDWPEDTIFRDDLLDPKWAAGASVEFKDKKGGNLAEFPEELRIRQFPGENA